jgi:hypothetical protein
MAMVKLFVILITLFSSRARPRCHSGNDQHLETQEMTRHRCQNISLHLTVRKPIKVACADLNHSACRAPYKYWLKREGNPFRPIKAETGFCFLGSCPAADLSDSLRATNKSS